MRRDNPAAAQRVAQTIYERLTRLGNFPHSGRHGRVEGTRELPLPPLPFIVVYRLRPGIWRRWFPSRLCRLWCGPL
ncbi:MAG: type II toxin-antitoxin system RelE/ParE family toxin [Bryobacteraceae bacterium]